jgi:hypothetical protein
MFYFNHDYLPFPSANGNYDIEWSIEPDRVQLHSVYHITRNK